jgi:hypothetical protein
MVDEEGSSAEDLVTRARASFVLWRQLVVIAKITAEAKAERSFCIAGEELVAVAGKIKIERVLWVHIDEDQIGVAHSQFSEPKLRSVVRHVIARDLHRRCALCAVLLHHFISNDRY